MSKFGFQKAFSYKNITFFGGTASNLARSFPFDMVLNLSGETELFEDEADEVFKNFNAVNAAAEETPRLDIDWPDFGLPKLSPNAWFGLAMDIEAFCNDNKKKYEIAVLCVGGHGRTGTTLAILKSILLKEKSDPVASIRKSYEEKAVETYGQIQYISFVTGKKSNAKPVPVTTVTSSSTANNPGFKPLATTLQAAKAAGILTCKHWFDTVGTRMKDCKDCDVLVEWIKVRNAEMSADKYVASKTIPYYPTPHSDHVRDGKQVEGCSFCNYIEGGLSHEHHKVYISSCKECQAEDEKETAKIMMEYAEEKGIPLSEIAELSKTDLVPVQGGYVEADAEELIGNLLKSGFEQKH